MIRLRLRLPRIGVRDRRALQWGLLMLIPPAAFRLVIQPYVQDLSRVHNAVRAGHSRLAREQQLVRIASALPAIERRASDSLLARAPSLFPGVDPVTSAGAVTRYIDAIAATAHVLVHSIEARPAEPVGEGVIALPVALRIEGDLEGVLTFLDLTERGPKLVRVQSFALERTEGRSTGAPDAGVLTLNAIVSAYALSERGAVRTARDLPPPAREITIPTERLTAEMDSTLDHDPFTAARTRPAERFRLPGEAASPATIAARGAAVTQVRLIGTVVAPGVGAAFAMCQIGTDPPRVIRTGDRVGGLTLREVQPGRAIFLTASGAPIEVRAPQAGG